MSSAVAALVVASVALVKSVSLARAPRIESPTVTSPSEASSERAQVTTSPLRERNIRAAARAALTPTTRGNPTSAPPSNAARPPTDDEAEEEPTGPEIDTTVEEHRAQLELRFDSEPLDAAWAPDARQRAEAHLTSSLPPSSKVRSLDCRSSICRAEVEHHDLEAHQSFLKAAILSGARVWRGPISAALSDTDPDSYVTVAFLGKPGTSLAESAAD